MESQSESTNTTNGRATAGQRTRSIGYLLLAVAALYESIDRAFAPSLTMDRIRPTRYGVSIYRFAENLIYATKWITRFVSTLHRRCTITGPSQSTIG